MKVRITISVIFFVLMGGALVCWHNVYGSQPEIAQGIPTNDREEASKLFDARVVSMFPKGSDTKPLVTFLVSNGFEQSYRFDQWKSAVHVEGSMCPSYWKIKWQSDENMGIIDIEGTWDNDCY